MSFNWQQGLTRFDQYIQQLQQQIAAVRPVQGVRYDLAHYDPEMQMACAYGRRLMESVRTSSPVINIEDATRPPKVGEIYGVLCIRSGGYMDLVWPLLGEEHDDSDVPELGPGAAVKHWHFDYRFLHEALYNVLVKAHADASGAVAEDIPGIMMHEITAPSNLVGKLERRALRCARTHHRFNPQTLPWLPALEKKVEGKRVECNKCPHRNFSLVGAYTDAKGVRYCPGHGLGWHKDGGLVRQS